MRYFKIVSNFTRLAAREITYNNFEISLVVYHYKSCYYLYSYTNNAMTKIMVTEAMMMMMRRRTMKVT